jgi:hypothetical protein
MMIVDGFKILQKASKCNKGLNFKTDQGKDIVVRIQMLNLQQIFRAEGSLRSHKSRAHPDAIAAKK